MQKSSALFLHWRQSMFHTTPKLSNHFAKQTFNFAEIKRFLFTSKTANVSYDSQSFKLFSKQDISFCRNQVLSFYIEDSQCFIGKPKFQTIWQTRHLILQKSSGFFLHWRQSMFPRTPKVSNDFANQTFNFAEIKHFLFTLKTVNVS